MFKKVLLLFVVLIAGILIGGGAVYLGVKTYPTFFGLPMSQGQAQSEVDTLLSEIGQFMSLPADEKPTVATVTDVEKIKSQSFFRNAQNGDSVIIYSEAKKAILYRKSEKKIIEVGTININNQPLASTAPVVQSSTVPLPTSTPTPTPVPTPVPTSNVVPTISPVPQGGN